MRINLATYSGEIPSVRLISGMVRLPPSPPLRDAANNEARILLVRSVSFINLLGAGQVQVSWFRVQGSGFRVPGSGFWVLGFWVLDSGFWIGRSRFNVKLPETLNSEL
jgi:hypothetical protein